MGLNCEKNKSKDQRRLFAFFKRERYGYGNLIRIQLLWQIFAAYLCYTPCVIHQQVQSRDRCWPYIWVLFDFSTRYSLSVPSIFGHPVNWSPNEQAHSVDLTAQFGLIHQFKRHIGKSYVSDIFQLRNGFSFSESPLTFPSERKVSGVCPDQSQDHEVGESAGKGTLMVVFRGWTALLFRRTATSWCTTLTLSMLELWQGML